MALLPPGLLPQVALAIVLAGTAWVVVTKRSKAYAMAVVLLVVFAVQQGEIWFLGHHAVTSELALRPATFLSQGDWWTALTFMYLHAGFLHIFGNLFVLVTVGPLLEDRVSERAFLITYFLAGLAGVPATLYLAQSGAVDPTLLNLGASGAIFGILGAFAMLFPRERIPMLLVYFLVWLPSLVVLVLFTLFVIVLPLLSPASNVAWYGHLAGLVVGFGAYLVLSRRGVGEGHSHRGGGTTSVRGTVDVTPLRPLAETSRAERYLSRLEAIEGSTPDDATWTEAWLDRFVEEVRCPQCGSTLRREGRRLVCEAGDWDLKIPERSSAKDAA